MIADVTLSSQSDSRTIDFTVDQSNKAFELMQAKVFVFCPAESDAGSLYGDLRTRDVGGTLNIFRELTLKSKTSDYANAAEIFTNGTAPSYARVAGGAITSSNSAGFQDKLYWSVDKSYLTKIKMVGLSINTGRFIAGTRIVILGLNA